MQRCAAPGTKSRILRTARSAALRAENRFPFHPLYPREGLPSSENRKLRHPPNAYAGLGVRVPLLMPLHAVTSPSVRGRAAPFSLGAKRGSSFSALDARLSSLRFFIPRTQNSESPSPSEPAE